MKGCCCSIALSTRGSIRTIDESIQERALAAGKFASRVRRSPRRLMPTVGTSVKRGRPKDWT